LILDAIRCLDLVGKLFHNPSMHDKVTVRTQPLNVTLDLSVVTWALTVTLCLDVVDICVNVFSNDSMHDKVTVRHQNSSCENEYLQTISVTLTLEVGTRHVVLIW
jgi:hypothetical protein